MLYRPKLSIKYFAFLLLLGCAAQQEHKREQASTCSAQSQEASHISIATKARAQMFSGCFANYLKLNKIEEIEVKVCNHLTVRANGTVAYARVSGDGADLPTDLRWCLEQQLWGMDYSKLQFSVSQKISFPMHFEVRK